MAQVVGWYMCSLKADNLQSLILSIWPIMSLHIKFCSVEKVVSLTKFETVLLKRGHSRITYFLYHEKTMLSAITTFHYKQKFIRLRQST